MILCKIIEQKKRAIEERAVLEDDKRHLENRLEEKRNLQNSQRF